MPEADSYDGHCASLSVSGTYCQEAPTETLLENDTEREGKACDSREHRKALSF
jgi:hypothetical protein